MDERGPQGFIRIPRYRSVYCAIQERVVTNRGFNRLAQQHNTMSSSVMVEAPPLLYVIGLEERSEGRHQFVIWRLLLFVCVPSCYLISWQCLYLLLCQEREAVLVVPLTTDLSDIALK